MSFIFIILFSSYWDVTAFMSVGAFILVGIVGIVGLLIELTLLECTALK